MAAGVGFESATLRTKGTELTTEQCNDEEKVPSFNLIVYA